MSKLKSLVPLFFILLSIGCIDIDKDIYLGPIPPMGEYRYVAYDPHHIIVAEGSLSILQYGRPYRGFWNIQGGRDKKSGPPFVSVQGGALKCEENPPQLIYTFDNYGSAGPILIKGKFVTGPSDGARFRGVWYIVGSKKGQGGAFEAQMVYEK